jgi:hypothetical protein
LVGALAAFVEPPDEIAAMTVSMTCCTKRSLAVEQAALER